MKTFIIGHADAVQGFALVGVPGRSVATAQELLQALDVARHDPSIGIIMLTTDVVALAREPIEQIKARTTIPLLVEIPGPEVARAEPPPFIPAPGDRDEP